MVGYPESLGFAKGSETSRAAAEKAEPKSKTQEKIIFDRMYGLKLEGITIDEVAVLLECETGTASARMRGLELKGTIFKTDRTRPTRSGLSARVYALRGI